MSIKSTIKLSLRFVDSVKEISPTDWNNLAGEDYPFLRHEFLLALENSNCTSTHTGWQPFHCIVEDICDPSISTLVAYIPMYLKTNSSGEYVFDWSWADAYHQNNLQYYPKLLSAIPFTPSSGPRFCINQKYENSIVIAFLAKQIPQEASTYNVSGWHILFPEAELSHTLHAHGFQQRVGCQYQWFNDNFTSFTHFLEKFTSRKRKSIKKERAKVFDNGIKFEVINGHNISDEQWQLFFQFYQNTYLIRGRQAYLNLKFFKLLGRTMPENLLLVLATKDGEYIAGALSFISKNTLYGRYWGCSEEFQFLHFETCYYQGIEYCIANNIGRFDSGAQGEHKIQRGFEPVLTYSNHWLSHPQFNIAITRFLDEEEKHIHAHIKYSKEMLPFKVNQE